MVTSGTLRARRRLVIAASVLVAVVASTVSVAYAVDVDLDGRHRDAVDEHLRTNQLLGTVLAELASLELYYDAVNHSSDGREEALTATFDPESSLQLMSGLLAEHEVLHHRFGSGDEGRVAPIEARFDALSDVVRSGLPLSGELADEVTWRILNFDLTTSLSQARQWHSEAFDVESSAIAATRSTVRTALLALLLVGGIVGAFVLVKLFQVLREAERREARTRAALRDRHQELQHALADARTASEAKTRFVANTSHELRTPLTAIIGFTDVLSESALEPEQIEHLNLIYSNADHLLQLIDDVLDIARIESGEVTASLEEVDIASLLEQVANDLQRLASGRPVEVITDLPTGARRLVTDRVKLRQIVMNLVGNALKFTEEGSVTVSLQVNDGGIPTRIDVVDTGIGIAPDRIEAVREPFRQADDERTRRFGGAGLGLSISLGLADLLGYHLDITSQLGVGSTFSLLLRPQPPDSDAGLIPGEGTAGSVAHHLGDRSDTLRSGGVGSPNAR